MHNRNSGEIVDYPSPQALRADAALVLSTLETKAREARERGLNPAPLPSLAEVEQGLLQGEYLELIEDARKK